MLIGAINAGRVVLAIELPRKREADAMQSVADAFSVEEVDSVRKIAQSVQVAWKKDYRSTVRFFTIGVSSIGGNDIIAGPAAAQTTWNRYLYNDESSRALRLEYERELNMPLGGLVKAIADVQLDNTSGRYLPSYMGGNSEIFTAVAKPGRPLIINAGFNYGGIDNMIPQFVGLTNKPPKIDLRSKTVDLSVADFMDYIQNSYVDKTAMFTATRSDLLIQQSLQALGFSTSQYDLDTGVNIVKFGLFETGEKWGDYVDQIVKAENGHLYQNEEGVIKFDNRQKWATFPYFNVQRVITTSQVINATAPDDSHIINVVEVTASPRQVQSSQLIWQATSYAGSGIIALPPGDTEVWASYNDPVFSVVTPTSGGATSKYVANTLTDGTGTDATSSVVLKAIANFAQSSKLTFTNNSSSQIYLTTLDLWGRPARKTGDIYYKESIGNSVTAYGEKLLQIKNDYIQDSSWAQSLAEIILADYASPTKLQTLTIRAMPELQFGDLVSWQGHYWRVYSIKTRLDPSQGFIQDLKLLQRSVATYFQIGVSMIGGNDKISA